MNFLDEIYFILFEKSSFFDINKPFHYHFPNSSLPHITLINNKPYTPFFSEYLNVKISSALKILATNGYYLRYLHSKVVNTISKFLNRALMKLCLAQLHEKKIREKKKKEKQLRKKNYWMTKLSLMIKNKDQFFISKEILNDDQPEELPIQSPEIISEPKIKIKTPLCISKNKLLNYYIMNYDSLNMLNFKFRILLSQQKRLFSTIVNEHPTIPNEVKNNSLINRFSFCEHTPPDYIINSQYSTVIPSTQIETLYLRYREQKKTFKFLISRYPFLLLLTHTVKLLSPREISNIQFVNKLLKKKKYKFYEDIIDDLSNFELPDHTIFLLDLDPQLLMENDFDWVLNRAFSNIY